MKKLFAALAAFAITIGPFAMATGFQPEPSDNKPASDTPPAGSTSSGATGLPSRDAGSTRLPTRHAHRRAKTHHPKRTRKHHTAKRKHSRDDNW